jgi:hypothetical protein
MTGVRALGFGLGLGLGHKRKRGRGIGRHGQGASLSPSRRAKRRGGESCDARSTLTTHLNSHCRCFCRTTAIYVHTNVLLVSQYYSIQLFLCATLLLCYPHHRTHLHRLLLLRHHCLHHSPPLPHHLRVRLIPGRDRGSPSGTS